MSIEYREAADLSALVQVVLEVKGALQIDSFLWFRGVNCASLPLLPKLLRDAKTDEQVIEREGRLLTRFRQRGLAYWPAGYPQTEWEQMFAMQHFGMPTRLLDWSENLFIAAHFALNAVAHASGHDGVPCTPVVWCIDPVLWNRSMPGLSQYGSDIGVITTADEDLEGYEPKTVRRRPKPPVAIYGTHNSQRIVAQRGTFTVWGSDTQSFEGFARATASPVLWSISLIGDRAALLADLQTLGFLETMVFPELSYLAIELTRAEGWR